MNNTQTAGERLAEARFIKRIQRDRYAGGSVPVKKHTTPDSSVSDAALGLSSTLTTLQPGAVATTQRSGRAFCFTLSTRAVLKQALAIAMKSSINMSMFVWENNEPPQIYK